jgi:phosphomevalonate kinase
MTVHAASAPGKVVLFGEYAVLLGAPALSMAVDRRAHVSVRPATGAGDQGIDRGILNAVCNALQLDPNNWTAKQDTGAFFSKLSGEGADVKLGLGSSAALTVALCKALAGSNLDAAGLLSLCRLAHRQFQGGVGSGVDVATSVLGGLIRYRVTEILPEQAGWPAGLLYRLLWSGFAASTIGKLAHWQDARKPKSCDTLGKAAEAIADCWQTADADAVMDEARLYVDALATFDKDHELGVFAAGHSQLVAEAKKFGLVYKPCGAGGGDVGVVLGKDREAMEGFANMASASGFQPLNTRIDYRGASWTHN